MKGQVSLTIVVILSLLHSFAEVDGFQSLNQRFCVNKLKYLPIQSQAIAPVSLPKIVHTPILRANPLFSSIDSSSSQRNPGFLKRLWNVTFGWIVTWLSRLLTALARKNTKSSEGPIESIAIMKDIAKEDEKKEVRDDVIIVSSSVPITPTAELMTQASTAIPPKDDSVAKDLGLQQARKLVEKKLKEIEEQRKLKQPVITELPAAAAAVTKIPPESVAPVTANIIASPEIVNPIIEVDSSELESQSSSDAIHENLTATTLPAITTEEVKPQIVEEPFADIKSPELKITETSLPITETPIVSADVTLNTLPVVQITDVKEETEDVTPSSSLPASSASTPSSSIFPTSKFKFADFKSKGVSGVIAYTLTEAGFWAIYPLLIFFYKISVGDPLDEDMTSGSTVSPYSSSDVAFNAYPFLGTTHRSVSCIHHYCSLRCPAKVWTRLLLDSMGGRKHYPTIFKRFSIGKKSRNKDP